MSEFVKRITKNDAKREEIVLELRIFCHKQHSHGVKMLANFTGLGIPVNFNWQQCTGILLRRI